MPRTIPAGSSKKGAQPRKKQAASHWLPFEEALVIARSKRTISMREWREWHKWMRPVGVPSHPDRVYKHAGWQGWRHWIGSDDNPHATRNKKSTRFLAFADALAVARSLGLHSSTEWEAWRKSGARPANIPSRPEQAYTHEGWQGWGHWLGTGNRGKKAATTFLSFAEALSAARSLGLNSQREWLAWCKRGARPANMPSRPSHIYEHDGWQGWGHWLGTGNQHSKDFLPFVDALAAARSLGLNSQKEWRAWSTSGARPANMPSNPQKKYKHEGWQRWGHWLGTGNEANTTQMLPFVDALAAARLLGLNSSTEWYAWCKSGARPANMPSTPHRTYKHVGWQGWGHWLGAGRTNNRKRQPAADAASSPSRKRQRTR